MGRGRATLTALRDHTVRLEELPYLSGVLLCVAAVLTVNSKRVEIFCLSQSLLRACLDRTPARATTDLASMMLIRRAQPGAPPESQFGRVIDPNEIMHRYNLDPEPAWKSRLLQEALDAQLALWDARGLQLTADELLRMLLVRGGVLRAARSDTIWLISELKAIYQPHLDECDEMAVALLWLILLEVCSQPRTKGGDDACEYALAWLTARGGQLQHLKPCFEELHSSARRGVAAMGGYHWLGGNKAEDENWWLVPVGQYLATLRALCPGQEEQKHAFAVMLEVCCLTLMLETAPMNAVDAADDAAPPAGTRRAATRAFRAAARGAMMLGGCSTSSAFDRPQHAATAQLFSSLFFSLLDRDHAAKLRENMQWLVVEPPEGERAGASCSSCRAGRAAAAGEEAAAATAAPSARPRTCSTRSARATSPTRTTSG